MDRQLELIKGAVAPKDVVYTPRRVAKLIIDWLNPQGICLDPCVGGGSFYEQLPAGADWCEIKLGRDFFEYSRKVDWIIGNPPYSLFERWLIHSFEIADEVAYILPTNKVFQRQLIMRLINSWGGIKGLKVHGSGSLVGFDYGYSVGTFHFSRGYKGLTNLVLG